MAQSDAADAVQAALETIERDMRRVVSGAWDPEWAHVHVDKSLIDLVRAICPVRLKARVEAILADYERVEKWYA